MQNTVPYSATILQSCEGTSELLTSTQIVFQSRRRKGKGEENQTNIHECPD